jgi:PAS domain-containing protein
VDVTEVSVTTGWQSVKIFRNSIPDDVYVEFVRSLFTRVHMILTGAVIHSLAAYLAYWDSGKPIYAWLSAMLLVVGLWRWTGMWRVKRTARITTRAEAERWERFYIIRGTLQGLVLSTFCFVGLYLDSGYFAAIAALSVTVGSMPSVVGRNYGSARMVRIFAAALVAPIGAGFVMHGELAYVVFGLLIVPFYLIITGTADDVRKVLFSAVIGHREARQLAQRFDRALNTMSHGLVMLSPEGRVIVANSEAAKALRIDNPDRLLGRSLRAVLMRGVAGGLLSLKDCRYVETQLTRALREGRNRKLQVRAANGRHFEMSARSGNDELGVITFEEITGLVSAEVLTRLDEHAKYGVWWFGRKCTTEHSISEPDGNGGALQESYQPDPS